MMVLSNGMLMFGGQGIVGLPAGGIRVRTAAPASGGTAGFKGVTGDTCRAGSGCGDVSITETRCGTVGRCAEAIRLDIRLAPSGPCELVDFSACFEFLPGMRGLWPAARRDFHWIPSIKRAAADVVGDHLFRSPVVIASAQGTGAALIPILDAGASLGPARRYLDLRFHGGSGEADSAPEITYGACGLRLSGHVYFEPDGEPFPVGAEGIGLSFFILLFASASPGAILQTVTDFLWDFYAESDARSVLPQTVPFDTYAAYGNGMALQYLWENGPGPQTGGICLTTFRREDGVMRGREYADDIWFHCWFNNMRTAMELAAFGARMGRPAWVERSREIAACLLSAPQRDGVFPTIYAPRGGGWVCSSGHGGGKDLYSLPDCSWSAIWLRKYRNQYGGLPEADGFLARYRDFLYRRQNPSGGFPCWVGTADLRHDPRLEDSASGALSVWFLGEELLCGAVPADERGRAILAVERGAGQLLGDVLPQQRFEDFELYYSCSPKPLGFYDAITCLHGQNTLAMQWCAEALRVAHLATGKKEFLEGGLYCLNVLCLYQQVWRHPDLDFHSFGGFGVMNTDGEWNDARQAQFAETLSNYYDLTGNIRYLQRAVAAARAGFALMAIDENRRVCPRNYQGAATNFEVHGASAENYGHAGRNERSYQSGFHWGTGSALVTAARLREKYADVYIDVGQGAAVGIDGVAVTGVGIDGGRIALGIDSLPGLMAFRIRASSPGPGGAPFTIAIQGFDVSYDPALTEYMAVVSA